jgi:hypothetical protein
MSAWRSNCATFRTRSRRIKLNRCTSTVRTLMANWVAISRLVYPCATSRKISFWRGVKVRPDSTLPAADVLYALGTIVSLTPYVASESIRPCIFLQTIFHSGRIYSLL